MKNENFDLGVFESPEFKALERYIMIIHNQILTKLGDNKVFSPDNPELYYQWLNYQGIRTGLKIWLNLIMFIKSFHKRKRFNKEFISVIQGVLTGLKLPLIWLGNRRKEDRERKEYKEDRENSEATKSKKVNNSVDPALVAEFLSRGNDGRGRENTS